MSRTTVFAVVTVEYGNHRIRGLFTDNLRAAQLIDVLNGQKPDTAYLDEFTLYDGDGALREAWSDLDGIDQNRLTDDIKVSLNETDPMPAGDRLPPLPKRPGGSAPKQRWREYCAALGADLQYLEGLNRSQMSKDDLIGLADRLGG